ncbi:MAG: DNA-3-methyladenine glycosylase I [Synergistaceae bacterium]|nr:DNA-3-methyladenine glycosylase I [Synergistaceae bacterium]
MSSLCRAIYEGDEILEKYHDFEWCKPNHNDRFQFEMLCLEAASVGLSWATVMHKRECYKKIFHNFDIDSCAAMRDSELENALLNPGIIRNRRKVFGVRSNAIAVQKIQKEFGSFDAYLWGFSNKEIIDGHWKDVKEIPTSSEISVSMSKDLKKRGISFVGPVITYSFMQAIGILTYSPTTKVEGFWYQQTLRSYECLTGSPPMVDAPTTFTTKTFNAWII